MVDGSTIKLLSSRVRVKLLPGTVLHVAHWQILLVHFVSVTLKISAALLVLLIVGTEYRPKYRLQWLSDIATQFQLGTFDPK